MKKKKCKKEIAFKDNTINKENLPFPIVLYPGFYGAFFGFKKEENGYIFLCSCAKEAIENYIRLRLSKPVPQNSEPARMFILDKMCFPKDLVDKLMKIKVPNNNVFKYLEFENKLCHECNKIVPDFRYCHEMYGPAFKQNYGWYINKQGYEYGVEPISNETIPEICPQEILELIKLDPVKTVKLYYRLQSTDFGKSEKLRKELEKQTRAIWNIIENEVRQKFGHKKIGEAWTSETILYYIVKSLFPNETILRHYRPNFLEGLEIDVFIKELKIGIEYQGIQHFKPVKHWGGKKAFDKLKERDEKKKKLCNTFNTNLVYFNYEEELSNNFVLSRIKKHIGSK